MVGPHVDPGVMGYLMCGLLSKSAPALREFFIDNLLVRVHFIIVMIRWTGLAPWKFELPFPGSLTSTFLSTGQVPTWIRE